jgi:NitT/TauT family transport system substrate-binding protein
MRHDPVGAPEPARSGRCLRARLLLGAVGLAVVTAAGCSSAASAGGPVSGTITIAAIPGMDTASLYLAQKDGYFAAEGMSHVIIKTYTSESAALTALQNGQASIAASDYGDIFYAQSQTPNLKVLADSYDAAPGVLEILTMPGSRITSPADLAGQTIGVPNDQQLPNYQKLPVSGSDHPVSLETAAATQVLTNYLGNAALSGGLNWEPMSQQQELAALQNHSLPAVLVSQPYIYEAESDFGAVEVLDAYSGSTAGLPLTGYVATNAWVSHNAAAVADFQAAIGKAQTQATMTGQVQQLLPQATGMTALQADLSTIGTYPTSTSVTGLERVVRLLTGDNLVPLSNAPAVPPMIVKPGS